MEPVRCYALSGGCADGGGLGGEQGVEDNVCLCRGLTDVCVNIGFTLVVVKPSSWLFQRIHWYNMPLGCPVK